MEDSPAEEAWVEVCGGGHIVGTCDADVACGDRVLHVVP